ncbi:MAG TPA: 1-acyl-sn-glycerol-3-phosphate acyltransferase, partial [Actinomycetota bacterium]|nr:1-acyl-sn-glycerol-3-phosphate acyltransferase [Actinomycetota bacterium]
MIARTVTLGWFRAVEVTGLERIPRTGPVLLVANHHGRLRRSGPPAGHGPTTGPLRRDGLALPDLPPPAAARAGRSDPRPSRPGRGRRRSGAASERRCVRRLFRPPARRGAIGIFPEGQASDEPHLLPVRTGAARIALGAHARGAMGVRIVPVGLIYEDKQRARSRAYVRVGNPIAMDEDLATNPAVPPDETDRDAVIALTRAIEERLADAALDFQSAEHDQRSGSQRVSRSGGSTPTLAGAHPSERWS